MEQKLTLIKEALMHISTKGEDTILMADCLRALQEVIVYTKQITKEEEK